MSGEGDPWKIDELRARESRAMAMGGETRIARQHGKGRQTARERISKLLDADTFDEVGMLTHSDMAAVRDVTPADGKITGFGQIDRRDIVVVADDVTVMAGAAGRVGTQKAAKLMAYTYKKGIPCVVLGDTGGARVPDIMGSDGMMGASAGLTDSPRNRRTPLITTILGECYGGATWTGAVSDIVVQVKGSVMCVGGSAILTVATGEQTTDQELGGWELHAYRTGLVDIFVDDEAQCFEAVRAVLSYLPSSSNDLPPVIPCADDPEADVDGIFDVVPENPRHGYDMHRLLELIADEHSLLELKPHFDGSLITTLARIDGHVTGILANNPMVTAGAMGPGACEKASAFIALCDSYHIPLLFVHDTPGFLVGKTAEEGKMALKVMTFIEALAKSTVPRVSLIVRKSYGMAHNNMSGGNMGNDQLFAWPTADVSFMAPDVAVNVVYGRKLKQADDPESLRRQYIDELNKGSEPWAAAGANLIDRIIHPKDTRKHLIRAFRRARGSDGQRGKSQRLLANWPRMF